MKKTTSNALFRQAVTMLLAAIASADLPADRVAIRAVDDRQQNTRFFIARFSGCLESIGSRELSDAFLIAADMAHLVEDGQ